MVRAAVAWAGVEVLVSCPVKMNTYDAEGQMVICMSREHSHCGGCYEEIEPGRVYCSDECRKMVESYDPEEP